MLFNLKSQKPILIEAGENDFHLMGNLDGLLNQTAQLNYLSMQQLVGKLTIKVVLKFEKYLLINYCYVFQCYFINTMLRQNFLKYCREQTEPVPKLNHENNHTICAVLIRKINLRFILN